MNITGKTAIVLMLADPVEHIRGTVLINESFSALGIDAVIFPLHVRPANLEECLGAIRRMENVRGLGLTIPHKIAAVRHMDQLTDSARRLGAVNFVRRDADGTLTGDNMDGIGFIRGLEANEVSAAGKRCVVVGCGGVGRAIAIALAEHGARALTLANRDVAKAAALAAEIRQIVPGCDVTPIATQDAKMIEEADLLVNATSLGMRADDPLPLSIDRLRPETVVAEVIVNPEITPLLSKARKRGCRIVVGSAMLRPQPELVARFFGLIPSP